MKPCSYETHNSMCIVYKKDRRQKSDIKYICLCQMGKVTQEYRVQKTFVILEEKCNKFSYFILFRYFHICKTGQYRKIFTNKLLVFYVLLIWIYTMAWTCQGWTGWTDFEYNESMYICIFDGKESISYNVCLAIVGMFIPMVVVAVTYCLIFLTVKKSRKAMEAHRKRVHSSSRGSNMDTVGKVTPDPDAIKRMARNVSCNNNFKLPKCSLKTVTGIH